VLRSVEPVVLGRWHRVTAERVHKDGTMTVDGGAPGQRSSPGKSQGLNLRSPLYLGGVEPPLRPPTNASFQGCIGEVSRLGTDAGCPGCVVPWVKPPCLVQVSINGKKVDLSYSFLRSRGVGQCGQSSPCLHAPCLHGGRCLPLPASSPPFRCLCTPGFSGEHCGAGCVHAPGVCMHLVCVQCVCAVLACSVCERAWEVPRPCVPVSPCATIMSPGPRCERAADRCLEHNPCLHGGTCKDNGCICPKGYAGPYCQHGELGVWGHGDMWGGATSSHHPLARRCGAVRAGPGLAGGQRWQRYAPQGAVHLFFPFCTQTCCWGCAQQCLLTPSPCRHPGAVQRHVP